MSLMIKQLSKWQDPCLEAIFSRIELERIKYGIRNKEANVSFLRSANYRNLDEKKL